MVAYVGGASGGVVFWLVLAELFYEGRAAGGTDKAGNRSPRSVLTALLAIRAARALLAKRGNVGKQDVVDTVPCRPAKVRRLAPRIAPYRRGSAKLALRIANNPVLRQRAVSHLRANYFALASVGPMARKRRTLRRIARTVGLSYLPMSVPSLEVVAGGA